MMHREESFVDFGAPYDLPRTLSVLQRGRGDPAVQVDPGNFSRTAGGTPGAGAWLCRRIYGSGSDNSGPDNSGSDRAGPELGQLIYRFDQLDVSVVRVRALATSEALAGAAAQAAPTVLGADDDWEPLQLLLEARDDHISAALAQVRHRHPGLRLPATGALFDQLVTATLEQKVTHGQARHSWRNLLRQHGEPPPSAAGLTPPEGMRLPLSSEQLRRVPSWQWHRMWVQPPLARTVLQVAQRAGSIHRLAAATGLKTSSVGELAQRLTAVPGVGPWTTAEALQRSHGAADLPAVGDFHLAHIVGEALTGRRTDDDGMLELLEPFRPHRQRVVRLLGLSGFRHQRFGPRLAPEDHRRR